MRTKGVAILAAGMFVASTFAVTDRPAANPFAPAKPGGVQRAQPESDVVLLIVSDPALTNGIALVAPEN